MSACFLLFVFLGVCSPRAVAGGRWIKTHQWSGNGTRQTELFPVMGRWWRIRYDHRGKGLFQISVYDKSGRLVDVAANLREELPGVHKVKGPGVFFLAVNGVDSEWNVEVEQYLTLVEEWRLHEEMKKPPAALRKYAVWTGEDADADYPIHIPRGSWKVVFSNEGAGMLQVLVRTKDRDFVALAANTDKPGTSESWVHASGDFVLHVTAMKTRWKVEVYGEGGGASASGVPRTKPPAD